MSSVDCFCMLRKVIVNMVLRINNGWGGKMEEGLLFLTTTVQGKHFQLEIWRTASFRFKSHGCCASHTCVSLEDVLPADGYGRLRLHQRAVAGNSSMGYPKAPAYRTLIGFQLPSNLMLRGENNNEDWDDTLVCKALISQVQSPVPM